MDDRRSEPRHMCADLVKVRILGQNGPEEWIANLEDISPSGACLQFEVPVAEGRTIEILCASCRFRGKVRYCRFVEIGHDVGVAFDERGGWSKRRYRPKHLLQLPVNPTKGAAAQTTAALKYRVAAAGLAH